MDQTNKDKGSQYKKVRAKELKNGDFLYESTIDKVISGARCTSDRDDPKTTVYIPIEQDIPLKDLNDKYGKSASCILRYTVQFGFSVFEHENTDILKQIDELRRKLRHSKNRFIVLSFYHLKIEPEKKGNRIKKTLRMDKNILSGIKECSDSLNISFSSFVQVLIDYALSTTGDRTFKEVKENAIEQKLRFEDVIGEILDFLIRLMNGEKEEMELDLDEMLETEVKQEDG